MISNHPPSAGHHWATAPSRTIHPYTGKGALTFSHFRPLVPESRVTSILLLEAPIDDDGGRDMISHEELKLLIYSRAVGIHNTTGTTAMGTS